MALNKIFKNTLKIITITINRSFLAKFRSDMPLARAIIIIESAIKEKKIKLLIKKIKMVRNKRNTNFDKGFNL